MNVLLEKLTGMDKMTDQVIATDYLINSKSCIQNYAIAITETTSSKLREVLVSQLNDMMKTHETISDYMMSKGYYHAYNLMEQKQLDRKVTDTALGLKNLMS